MWQRFTERARRTVFFAQEEARRLNEKYVSTEHLLLGLLRENDSVAARILDRIGVNPGRVRTEVERQTFRGSDGPEEEMHLTPRAKRVIDLAYEEARRLSNNYIGTEHLLVGLIRESDGLAGRVLIKMGASLRAVREQVLILHIVDKECEDVPQPGASIGDLEARLRERYEQVYGSEGLSPESATMRERLFLESLMTVTGQPNAGDLGTARSVAGRPQVEVAMDTETFQKLVDVYRAKDAHGYRQLAQGDQTMFLLPNGTLLKLLVGPAGGEGAAKAGGVYVRVLEGAYEGYAGWMFAGNFVREKADDTPFPPTDL